MNSDDKMLLYNLANGGLSAEEVQKISTVLDKYNIDFSSADALSDAYKQLATQPGDVEVWVENSDMVYEFLIDKLNESFYSIDITDELLETDEELAEVYNLLSGIEFL